MGTDRVVDSDGRRGLQYFCAVQFPPNPALWIFCRFGNAAFTPRRPVHFAVARDGKISLVEKDDCENLNRLVCLPICIC